MISPDFEGILSMTDMKKEGYENDASYGEGRELFHGTTPFKEAQSLSGTNLISFLWQAIKDFLKVK